ncbi:hypothetical protein EJ04DRAFT_499396 [Polyplosphaeria fusca]|uniref:AB hydrolase-1 domain-containing protein n=1 Tax=Polyplosphaeria fusca TaxID=682080 RepID=A0A9P4QU56_9PLEO|nr:hypothetical protein EJ04DRAFT_499396 [Polyplosphaeria fusca]
MLVGQSTAEYVLTRAFIYFGSYLGLICLVYFYLALSIGGVAAIASPISIFIEVIGAIEILFYLCWFLPYRHYLHKQRAAFPRPLTCEERKELVDMILAVTPDTELFVRKWMCGASLGDLRRENLKEWLLWALFDSSAPPGDDDEELEGYVTEIEERLGTAIKPGWGPAKSLRMNFDKFTVTHRTLLYYFAIGIVDLVTSIALLISGFSFYRQPRAAFIRSFPFRPFTLLAPNESAAPNISHFYRPHTSKTHRSIVFIHGVGVGLFPFLPLLRNLPKEIGIVAIELLPISSRITTAMPLAEDLKREIGDIVAQHDVKDFVLVANSYGTLLTRQFLESAFLASKLHSIVMIDPLSVLLHLPDMAYKLTKRTPAEANELQLWWVAQTEPDIAFTLSRRFCWREHVIWKEDLIGGNVTLIIGGRDCVVNSEAIAAYVTTDESKLGTNDAAHGNLRWTSQDMEQWNKSVNEWKGQGLELVWLEGLDHGQAFTNKNARSKVLGIIEKYCERDTDGAGGDASEPASETSSRTSKDGAVIQEQEMFSVLSGSGQPKI